MSVVTYGVPRPYRQLASDLKPLASALVGFAGSLVAHRLEYESGLVREMAQCLRAICRAFEEAGQLFDPGGLQGGRFEYRPASHLPSLRQGLPKPSASARVGRRPSGKRPTRQGKFNGRGRR